MCMQNVCRLDGTKGQAAPRDGPSRTANTLVSALDDTRCHRLAASIRGLL